MGDKSAVVRFGVSMSPDLLKEFDRLVEKRGFPNRSEAVRDMVRGSLVEERMEKNRDVIGTITIVYDHHQREMARNLQRHQHSHVGMVLSTLHIHLDAHNCLEVIVVRGKSRTVQKFADHVIGLKGVRHGRLVMTAAELD